MATYKRNIGNKGEDYAAAYLKKKGYAVLERNVYIGGGEIDIVVKKNSLIVFVEVKARKEQPYVDLLDTIDTRKEKNLIASCEAYFTEHTLESSGYRIDLIGVILKNEQVIQLEHIEGYV